MCITFVALLDAFLPQIIVIHQGFELKGARGTVHGDLVDHKTTVHNLLSRRTIRRFTTYTRFSPLQRLNYTSKLFDKRI